MIFEHYGECPFCKQQVLITSTKPQLTDTELAEEAIEMCSCDDARLDRGMKATETSIQGTLGEESMNCGMRYVAPENTIATVRMICQALLTDAIRGAVKLVIPGGDALRMVKNGNAVKIRRSTSKQVEL